MVPMRWVNDVRYYDVRPATIHYELDLDAFFIARADIRSPSHGHHLGLVVSVTVRDLTANRITLADAIARAHELVEQLVSAHRSAVDSIGAPEVRVFDFVGTRVR
jgi:hypothetical protein